ncbi:hypothetical protein [Natronorubrum halophilum]|uniref:hypothetical protein n=1 Tax=Natronorubrum halophilum TaxID=1702106 RepID=UPI0010C2442E|nr:hypothetical protein [Natronorubrum halophilum]
MVKGNVRNSDPKDIADELFHIGLHGEDEAKAYVYFFITDPPKQDAETVFNTPEEELEKAEALFSRAKKTIKVSNNVKNQGRR